MNINESDPTLCFVYADLTFGGAKLAQPHTFAAGDVKLYFPDGTSANATNLPTLVSSTSSTTTYKFQFAQAETLQRGDMLIEIASATVDTWHAVVNFDYPSFYANDAHLANLDATVSSRASEAALDADYAALASSILTRATPADVAGGGQSAQAIAAAVIAIVRTPIQQLGTSGYSIVAGDLEPPMPMQCVFGGKHVDLTGVTSVSMIWTKPDNTTTTVPVTITDAVNGWVQRVWSSGDTDQAGQHSGQLIATWPGSPVRHETFQMLYSWQVR